MGERRTIIQSPYGSVFTQFSDDELKKVTQSENLKIAVSGSIVEPGIINLPAKTTLREIIEKCGGMVNGIDFKAAQFGIPFGGLYTKNDLDTEITEESFKEGVRHTIIILSEDDCIVQYAKFYLEFLIGKIREGSLEKYLRVQKEMLQTWGLLDRISKGRSNMRDIYLIRELSTKIKTEVGKQYNITEDIINKFYDEISDHVEDNYCYTSQCNHLTKLTITKKCIGCRACVKVCPVDCIYGELKKQHRIDYNVCTHCGACVSICPVNAINSGNNTMKFLHDLTTPNKTVITQMAPSVRVAIGEAFGFEPGTNVERKLAAALRQIGVDYVFDTTWAADLTIMEEAGELQDRLERYFAGDKQVRLPILTSCCPAWVKFIEMNYADMLDVPSTAKSPMQMFATVAKDIWAKEKGLSRNEITSVAIMPCIAKKFEASRAEFSRGLNYDVDYVITTSELIDIFKSSGIDLSEIEGEDIDKVMGEYTGGGIIFGRTGGVIESAARTAIEKMTGKRVKNIEFTCIRGFEGFRSCELEAGDLKLRIGVAHGLREAGKMLDKIRSGEEFYHAIEIMACMGGCVGGGGQPRAKKREEAIKMRMEGLNQIDREKEFRRSYENPEVLAIYDKYLDHPLSHKAHELLHTNYFIRVKKDSRD